MYEAHGRAALEYGDPAEYNQCQTQLALLYAEGVPGHHAEFAGYRLLYQAVHARHGEGKKLIGTLAAILGNKIGQVAGTAAVLHAMQVSAVIDLACMVCCQSAVAHYTYSVTHSLSCLVLCCCYCPSMQHTLSTCHCTNSCVCCPAADCLLLPLSCAGPAGGSW